MVYKRCPPSAQLQSLIREFWIFENEDPSIHRQKIVPDGYSEIILHYGDPYKINLNGHWLTQADLLYSNQITSHFFLENTGKAGMIGIKLHPASFFELFGIKQDDLTDKVLNLIELLPKESRYLAKITSRKQTSEERIQAIEAWLIDQPHSNHPIRSAIDKVLHTNGMIDCQTLAAENHQSLRQFERTFKKVIGLTPKFYSRIIRFSSIFQKIRSHDNSWVNIALQSGYFDQSHFIRNFKEFTGEEPSTYGFDEQTLANFFLLK